MTVTNNLSATNFTTTNLTCPNLYNFINTSIITQCSNYNASIISFINTSIVNSQSNLLNITNLSVNNSSFSFANISTLTCKSINTSLLTSYGIGYLMLRAFNNYIGNTDYTNFSSNFNGLQLQKILLMQSISF